MAADKGRKVLARLGDGLSFLACRGRALTSSLKDAPDLPNATTPLQAARNGFSFVKQIQSSDGHFSAEYGGQSAATVLLF